MFAWFNSLSLGTLTAWGQRLSLWTLLFVMLSGLCGLAAWYINRRVDTLLRARTDTTLQELNARIDANRISVNGKLMGG